MKLLITGGHLSPALALIEELKKIKKEVEIIFVGRKYPLDKEKTLSFEYKEIERKKISFVSLEAGRLTRALSVNSLLSLIKVPLGFFQAFFIINKHRPNLIMSFGGYLALPIVFWGYVFRIPVFTHEQTIKPGLANRLISFFSKKIFVAFEEVKNNFPKEKTYVSGNPVKSSIFKIEKKPFQIKKDQPVIYVTGGSLGSHSVNLHIKKILEQLLEKFIIIHQVGENKEYHDFEDLVLMKKSLSKEKKSRYFLAKHFFDDEVGYVYSLTDLVVGRAGANTFFELLALKKPALFIPLPWSSGREQQHHAEIFAKAGAGEIFHQIEPSEKLLRLIYQMIGKIDYYQNNFKHL
ncbi:MAG: UDP-N-acetylglucosamine--N-acetylmuramyl-(pentapeptide) pyrophosphoryl-undecaprenol N-acetylglucosamine transferase, partial [Candidatus Roizmanbacteria bacterium]|nr:UDP-N-acetylglucosamine--N-acetylmuramyl-(pentapeptide) pyrophosphoryl-undecaprenol N-acetylglucosamine transferase [Candidatus Roizmanbacteria bacterium]